MPSLRVGDRQAENFAKLLRRDNSSLLLWVPKVVAWSPSKGRSTRFSQSIRSCKGQASHWSASASRRRARGRWRRRVRIRSFRADVDLQGRQFSLSVTSWQLGACHTFDVDRSLAMTRTAGIFVLFGATAIAAGSCSGDQTTTSDAGSDVKVFPVSGSIRTVSETVSAGHFGVNPKSVRCSDRDRITDSGNFFPRFNAAPLSIPFSPRRKCRSKSSSFRRDTRRDPQRTGIPHPSP